MIDDRSAWEKLANRITFTHNFEDSNILDQLPNQEACLDYLQLLDHYDVDGLSDVIESIEEGESAGAYNLFVSKYNLEWDKL